MLRPLRFQLLFIVFISLISVRPAQAQELTTFILVRHTETADDGTRNPALSPEGTKRAQRLAEHLGNADVTAVYSTPFTRTMKTAESVAQQKGLEVQEYDPFDSRVLQTILEKERGGTVLVVGHSNTTPFMVNQLIGQKLFDQLDESAYSNLFIVTVSTLGNGNVVRFTY